MLRSRLFETPIVLLAPTSSMGGEIGGQGRILNTDSTTVVPLFCEHPLKPFPHLIFYSCLSRSNCLPWFAVASKGVTCMMSWVQVAHESPLPYPAPGRIPTMSSNFSKVFTATYARLFQSAVVKVLRYSMHCIWGHATQT